MATQREIDDTYNYMDELFRLTFGEMADISCAMYNGDFSKTLEQAQKDKHDYVLDGLNVREGSKVLDIGCGWGPILNAVRERKGHGVGLTLSTKQADACRRNGFEVYLKNWRQICRETFGGFDAIVSIGSFEHFCSEEEYLAGKQDQVYADFFKLCYELLPEGGRLFLQTMMWGANAPDYQDIDLGARKGSNEYILAVLRKFYPNSILPQGVPQIVKCAVPLFKAISFNNGRADYIQTSKHWNRIYQFSWPKFFASLKLLPYLFTDRDYRYKLESFRGGYNTECFRRKVMDHQRIILERA
ncbi:MAG: class I SAM-dependent methyltransferase [Caldilineaceae bacterium]